MRKHYTVIESLDSMLSQSKTQHDFFEEIDKLTLKFMWKSKIPTIGKYFEKEVAGSMPPDFKTYYKSYRSNQVKHSVNKG